MHPARCHLEDTVDHRMAESGRHLHGGRGAVPAHDALTCLLHRQPEDLKAL